MKNIVKNFKKTKGSITIEASISLVLFTSVLVLLLSIINICRVQAAIGNAINISAIEMSQYSYFYEVTGLYSFDRSMQENAADASAEVNSIISDADTSIASVENLFTLVATSKEDIEDLTFAPSTEKVLDQYASLKDTYESTSDNIGSISSSIDSLSTSFEGIMKNPMDFAKGLAAIGISGGMNAAKSHLIAAPIARALSIQHIGNGNYSDVKKDDADLFLKSLGVKDGIDGLNFKLSTLFSANSPADINIIVVYEVKFMTLPFLGDLHITFAQSASTRGWLGGDQTKVPSPPVETVPTEEGIAKSIWTASNLDRGTYFKETLKKNNSESKIVPGNLSTMYGYYENTNTFYKCTSINTFSKTYNNENGLITNVAAQTAKRAMKDTLEIIKPLTEVAVDGNSYNIVPGEDKFIELLVIIPEDASAKVEKELQDYLTTYAATQNDTLKEDNISVSYRVVKAGGNAQIINKEGED